VTGADFGPDEVFTIIAASTPVDHERYRVHEESVARIAESADCKRANLAELSTDPPPPMLIDRLDPEGHTILFGTGGVGKGALTCEWLRKLVAEGQRPYIIDYEDHPQEWSRRLEGIGGDRSAVDIAYGLRKPLTDMCDTFAEQIEAEGHTVAVIDSVSAATMADTSKEETASAYAKAVAVLGVPVVSLAHVTKGKDERHVYPFGSVHWHTRARVTWSLSADASGLVLVRRKANNYPPQPRYNVALTFRDNILRDVSSERPMAETIGVGMTTPFGPTVIV